MGTSYSVKVVTQQNVLDKELIHQDIKEILTAVNQAMSTYIDDSELSQFNKRNTTAWQTLSPALYSVIKHAHYVSQITAGAFDPTVGPLVNLWGFGPAPRLAEIPDDNMVQLVKQSTGYEKLRVDDSAPKIAKADPALYLDLSGVAKGFAIDEIAAYLEQNNIENYLVEIGGDLIGKGQNAEQKSWQIGIATADSSFSSAVQQIIALSDIAMATSGDYRNYYETNGIRYSHTINPVTGKPITHRLASVTVLHQSAMHADAMATAFMVVGPEETMRMAAQFELAVFIIVKTTTGFKTAYNDYFKPYLLAE